MTPESTVPDPIDAVLDQEQKTHSRSRWILAAMVLGILVTLPFAGAFLQATGGAEGSSFHLQNAAVALIVLLAAIGLLVGLWSRNRICAWLLALVMGLDCLYQIVTTLMGATPEEALLEAMSPAVFRPRMVLILAFKVTVFVMAARAVDRHHRSTEG